MEDAPLAVVLLPALLTLRRQELLPGPGPLAGRLRRTPSNSPEPPAAKAVAAGVKAPGSQPGCGGGCPRPTPSAAGTVRSAPAQSSQLAPPPAAAASPAARDFLSASSAATFSAPLG